MDVFGRQWPEHLKHPDDFVGYYGRTSRFFAVAEAFDLTTEGVNGFDYRLTFLYKNLQ